MILNIGIIGSGNVATHLATEFAEYGHQILFIYSKNEGNAQLLARKTHSKTIKSLNISDIDIDVLIIAVNDDAIKDVAEQLKLSGKTIVVHTSGSIPLNILSNFENAGIFYPLQTFTKNRKVEFSEIPILIESNNEFTKEKLEELGRTISENIQFADSEKRKILHLAAVFANNFTNAMLSISEELLEQHHIDKTLLYPLAKETIAKALDLGAENAQTGPAQRGDLEVQKKHVELLIDNEKYQVLYKLLSEIISQSYL